MKTAGNQARQRNSSMIEATLMAFGCSPRTVERALMRLKMGEEEDVPDERGTACRDTTSTSMTAARRPTDTA